MATLNTESAEYESFEAYLRERGLKMTGPRETVLEAFLSLERHVTAEELFEVARRLDPAIGQATVFRTIKLLADSGLAREACRDETARRYEHAFHHDHHDHLLCVACGRTIEFRDEAIEEIQRKVYATWGFEAVSHQLELRGLCPACQKKRRAAQGRAAKTS